MRHGHQPRAGGTRPTPPTSGSGVQSPDRDRMARLERALREVADALQDEIESSMGRELRRADLPRAWHEAQTLLAGR